MKYIFFIGRAMFALVFLIKAVGHFCPRMIAHAGEMGVPMANVVVPFWGTVAIIGGLSILFGFKAKVGAWLVIIFLLPVTFFMHPFWQPDVSFAMRMHALCFWKNISIMGAALMMTYMGSGPMSLKP